MDDIALCPGEFHIVMAQLRCIGTHMENSGLDFCWTEADLYGNFVVKDVIEGKHVKRGIKAHLVTLLSLFKMYLQNFSRFKLKF